MKHLVVVVGPTASGKTAVASALARTWQTPVLTADSRQVFRELTIGTNKPTPEERALAEHRLLDLVAPDEAFTVADFEAAALAEIARVHEAQDIALLAGGTGFYLEAVLQGIAPTPPHDERVRAAVQADLALYGLPYLVQELAAYDPITHARIDRANPRRVTRAIEVIRHTGRPLSSFDRPEVHRPFRAHVFGLAVDRALLHQRIEARTEAMHQAGAWEEVRHLLQRYPPDLQAFASIGYREYIEYAEGLRSLPETLAAITTHTRQFARRQLTWFRGMEDVTWVPHTDPTTTAAFIQTELDRRLAVSGL